MIQFDEKYFEGEEIDGFYVEPMMKRCWAAQMELYLQLKSICDKHGLKIFADWGTLLGAIRHKGYVPWDDDMDVCMLRPDYNKLLSVISSELEGTCQLLSVYRQRNHASNIARFVNTEYVRPTDGQLNRYHKFPFIAGVDIFIMDYVPRDESKRKVWADLMEETWQWQMFYADPESDIPEDFSAIEELGHKLGFKFENGDREYVTWQLRIVLDRLCGVCDEASADEVSTALYQATNQFIPNYTLPKEIFSEQVMLPFGPIEVAVCKDYLAHVKMRYGEDYMTPDIFHPHNYPYYKEQQEYLEKECGMKF